MFAVSSPRAPLPRRQPFCSVTLRSLSLPECPCSDLHTCVFRLIFFFFFLFLLPFLFSMWLYWLLLVCCGLLAVAALPALSAGRIDFTRPRPWASMLNACLFIVFLTTSEIRTHTHRNVHKYLHYQLLCMRGCWPTFPAISPPPGSLLPDIKTRLQQSNSPLRLSTRNYYPIGALNFLLKRKCLIYIYFIYGL